MMLSRSDAAVVARDAALPGLALVLDADRFVAVLRLALPEAGMVAATPTYLRYKPGTSCVAGFRVTRTHGEPIELYAKAYGAAQYREVHARSEQVRAESSVMPARLLLDAAMTAIRPLTNDRELRTLQRLAVPELQARLLRRILRRAPDLAEAARLEVLRYKPERRFVGRVTRDGEPVAVLRVYGEADFGPALAGAALGAAAGGPVLLGARGSRRALAARWVRGRTLNLRAGAGASQDVLREVGATLARLHRLDLAHPARRTRTQEAQAVRQAAEAVQRLCPELGRRAVTLAREVAAALVNAPMRACPVHGDCAPDQVVIDGDAIVLIDWDSAASGDPAADLGSFLARLEMDALQDDPHALDPGQAAEALCAGYSATGPLPAATAVQTVAGLLRLAPEPFRKRAPDWHERIAALLDRAELLHRRSLPTLRVTRPRTGAFDAPTRCSAAARDPDLPLLGIALDRRAMRPLLAEALALKVSRVALGPPDLRRHKPGRHALIAYAITPVSEPGVALLGKMRAKGPDARTYDVQRALWSGGFGPSERDGIMVPEPVGMLPALHMWIQREVAGVPATSLLAPAADTTVVRRTAEALAKLHRADAPAPRRWSRIDEIALLRSRLRETASLRPELADTILGTLAGAEQVAQRLPDGAKRGIHRDFHPAQVLIDDAERVHIVDLDLYADGDPALDAGNFLAHLVELALRLHADEGALRRHEDAFLSRFLALSPSVAPEAVETWTALSLARHVFLSTRFPDRVHLTGALARICGSRMAEARRLLGRGRWRPSRAASQD